MMEAIGVRPSQIVQFIYAETMIHTLLASVIGLIVGGTISFVIATGANIGVGHITFIAPDYNRAPSSKKYLKQATELKHQIMQNP